MNPADTTTRFRGMMEGIRLLDVVQLCCRTAATCCVWVKNSHRSGFLWLADGEFVHAESGDLRGEEAAIAILTWHCGSFAIHNQVTTREASISTKWEALVMKAACTLDERRQSQDTEERMPSGRPPGAPAAQETTAPAGTETFASEEDVVEEAIEEPAPLRIPRNVPIRPVVGAARNQAVAAEPAVAAAATPVAGPARSRTEEPTAAAAAAKPVPGPARAWVEEPAAAAKPEASPAGAEVDQAEEEEVSTASPQAWLPGLGHRLYELSRLIGEALGLGLPETVSVTGLANRFTLEIDADGSARVSWSQL